MGTRKFLAETRVRTVPREDLELKKETHVHSLELTPDSVAAKKGSSKFEPI